MKNVTRKDIHLAIDYAILGKKRVVVFANPLGNTKRRVKVTRRTYGKQKSTPISNGIKAELLVTIGPLNYEEREFVKLCRRAKCKLRKLWFGSRKEVA